MGRTVFGRMYGIAGWLNIFSIGTSHQLRILSGILVGRMSTCRISGHSGKEDVNNIAVVQFI